MKKILIISQNKSLRGAHKAATELEKVLKKSSKNNVKFFSERDAVKGIKGNVKIKIFKTLNKYINPFFGKHNEITNTLPQIFKFFKHKNFNYDLILINYIYEFLSIKDIIKFEKPTVVFIHDMWFFGGIKHFFTKSSFKKDLELNFFNIYKIVNYFSWKFKKNYLQKNKKIIFIASSEWLKKQALSSVTLKNHTVEKINTPVDTVYWKKLNKATCRKRFNLPLKKKLVLFVAKGGLDNYRKGGDIFEKIILKNTNQDKINFIILGQQHKKILSNTFFVNFNDNNQKLRQLYNAVDLSFCLSRYENIPYSMLESMSCGTPNISVKVGGINEVIQHKKNGWILNNKNISSMNKSIRWCLNQNNYFRLSNNSIKEIKKRFSYSKIHNDYDKLFKRINT